MTSANNFKVGDRVESPVGCPGRVSKIEGAVVTVEYHERGKVWHGVYDDLWFRLYGGQLKNLETARPA